MPAPPTDSFHRKIDYLRMSITDRCNLRCYYCMPESGIPKIDHSEILRYEEIVRLAGIAISMGISKVRLTGGEPLVRRDALGLCENISKVSGLKSLSLTTNGVLLCDFAAGLFQAGIRRINVSLDTLKPERFAQITKMDLFDRVWAGIMTALQAGFSPVKLNAVVMRGVNDDEIEDLARLTFQFPFHVRFIEFMPFRQLGCEKIFVSASEILERLKSAGSLETASAEESNGPALHYRFKGAPGKIGIISPVSEHFCPNCNRLRVTADGKLRTCLFSNDEIDLRGLLRHGVRDEEIAAAILAGINTKPEKHYLSNPVFRKCISRPMFSIGG
ncbi:MAG TPA: GTP 3',8-cyclase MoaA [Syntrophobacteraceae bacterium]|nr:GTP 3',8-cyclase MoaA [Syntrophobacteraceae bacterium]